MTRKQFPWPLLYVLCGVLFSLPMVVPALAPIAYVSAAFVYLFEYDRSVSLPDGKKHPLLRAYGRGFLFLYAYGLGTFWWFAELYPLDFVGLGKGASLAVVLAGWFGLPLLQGIIGAFQFLLFHVFLRVCRVREKRCLVPPLAATLWCLFEYLQTLTWAGVPWGKLAMGQTGYLPLIQSVSLFGPYFIAFLIITVNVTLAMGFCAYREKKTPRAAVPCLLLAVLLFSGNLLYGACRIAFRDKSVSDTTVKAAAIQGNVSSKEKWGASSYRLTLDRYTALTEKAAEDGALLVVWPETALPYEIDTDSALADHLQSLSDDGNIYLFVGAFQRGDGDELLNALFLTEPSGMFGEAAYYKRRLVPFGEFVPMRTLFETVFPPLADLAILSEDLTGGEEVQLLETSVGKVGALICFDSIYESLARESVREGATLLLLSTNDSWFGDSSAVWQHNRHAILRAVENGRYVVRAANTGVSTVISDTGRVLSSLDPFETGYVSGEVEIFTEMTLYTKIGDGILLLCPLYLAFAAAFSLWQSKKEKSV